ncbi:MAG TPA: DUF2092 domain-containing protein [Tepidisphaeraceae bacterium]|jgi:hypothetical protein
METRRTIVVAVLVPLTALCFRAVAQQGGSGGGRGDGQAERRQPVAPAPAIDPKADALLKKMGEQLAAAKRFSFQSHAMMDQVMENGQKIQVARNQRVAVRRPDGVAASVVGDLEDLQFWYDGKQVALLNRASHTYGIAGAPPTIDATFDMLAEKYGLAIPLADILFADPYKTLIANARVGQYLGIGYVFEARCHHLAFRQPGVDWQVWIEDNEQAMPRKFVITYKENPSQPQYVSFLSNWKLSADVPDSAFTFAAPQDARRVDFGPAAPSSMAQPAKSQEPSTEKK